MFSLLSRYSLLVVTAATFRRRFNSYQYTVWPLCCDQPDTLTQGYYPRVGSMATNAAPRSREYFTLGKQTNQKPMSLTTYLAHNDVRAGFRNRYLLPRAALAPCALLSRRSSSPGSHPRVESKLLTCVDRFEIQQQLYYL